MNIIRITTYILVVTATIAAASFRDISIETQLNQNRIEAQSKKIAHELYQLKVLAYTLRASLWMGLCAGGVYMMFFKNQRVLISPLIDQSALNRDILEHMELCKNFNPAFGTYVWMKSGAKTIVEWTVYSIAIKKIMEKTELLAEYIFSEHDLVWFIARKTSLNQIIADIKDSAQLLERARIEGGSVLKEFALSSLTVASNTFIAQMELAIAFMHQSIDSAPAAGVVHYQLDTLPAYLTNSAQQLAQVVHATVAYDGQQITGSIIDAVARFESDLNKTKIRFARDSQRACEYTE